MQLGNPGASNINLLYSDTSVLRNEDFVVGNGNAFYGGKWVPAQATKYSAAQLHNPIASLVTVFLDQIIITVDTAQFVQVVAGSLELATISNNEGNKDLIQVVGSGVVKFEQASGIHSGPRLQLNLAAGIPFVLTPKFPWKINADEQITVQGETVNTGLTASFMWREI